MTINKIIALSLFPLFLASFLFSQSLAEVAKKEKERRESLKGKKSVVVTNADLANLKKKPAVEMAPPETAAELETFESEEAALEEEAAEPEVLATPEAPPPAQPAISPELEAMSRQKFEEMRTELEGRISRTREYIELLEMKMNGLWQEFYSLDDMTSRDQIQQAIADTFLKLQKAQEDETKAREELEKLLARVRRLLPLK